MLCSQIYFAGEYIEHSHESNPFYDILIQNGPLFGYKEGDPDNPPVGGFEKAGMISGRLKRNWASFMQHLPHSYEIKKDAEHIATKNVRFKIEHINGFPTFIVSAEHDIKAGEIIGFSYGPSYWQGKKPALFDKQGHLMEETPAVSLSN